MNIAKFRMRHLSEMQESSNESPLKVAVPPRLEYIDGLRGTAIFLVLLTHVWTSTNAPALSFRIHGHMVLLAAIPAAGNVGVDLFLVLSGFCLAWPFARDEKYRVSMTIAKFCMRRIRRIVPAYYVSIPVVMLISWGASYLQLGERAPVTPADLLTHVLFIHNLYFQHVVTITGAYWSIALEFQLYLFFPILLEIVSRWSSVRMCFCVLLLHLGFLTIIHLRADENVSWTYDFVVFKSVFGRMFEFACGMATAFYVARGRSRSWIPTFTAPLCLGLAFFLKGDLRGFIMRIDDLLWAAGFALLVAHTANPKALFHKIMSWRPLVQLGIVSFSVYLIHQPLVNILGTVLMKTMRPGKAFFAELALLPLVVGICVLFFLSVELPALRFASKVDNRHRVHKFKQLATEPLPASAINI